MTLGSIRPESDLAAVLRRVEKPGRYVGGEYGRVLKEGADLFRVGACYPDVYEIGMSNLAVRLLYRRLNAMEGLACERVFAPGRDFEAELRALGVPLYTLESGTPLHRLDLIGFSLGYELTATNMLAILDLGGVPVLREQRGEASPLVIAGGPAATNPAPFGSFLDGVFVGELEEAQGALFGRLAELKRAGAGRQDRLEHLRGLPFVWTADKKAPVRRVFWRGFGGEGQEAAAGKAVRAGPLAPYPVPGIRTVQDHGVVEIMRGCPNGCRFCHAGIYYRPFRQKGAARILQEVEEQVHTCGYREITLSSLSSGDYPGLPAMVRWLTRSFAQHKVSFSLPSLRINSLTLDLLTEVAAVRKSGLTFAVETPPELWQRGLNKVVSLEHTLALLEEARERGWKTAKFYFMVGLPVAGGADETAPIIEFLEEARRRTRMSLAANVSAFIPKPHTPFQWAGQLTEVEAVERIMRIKRALARRGVTVRYHAPFLSVLEGMISRGDQRAGELIHRAFRAGARFDSWEELVDRELWQKLYRQAEWDVEAETCRERSLEEPLPWAGVRLGVSQQALRAEYQRALAGVETAPCCASCDHLCGVCSREARPREADPGEVERLVAAAGPPLGALPALPALPAGAPGRARFSFVKEGPAVFLSHLNVMQIFERAVLRAGYLARFTEGFNPKPRLEFAQALSLGIASEGEVAQLEVENLEGEEGFRGRLNRVLPQGLEVRAVQRLPLYRPGEKKRSLMSLYWGADYRLGGGDPRLLERARALLVEERESQAGAAILSETAGALEVRLPAAGKGTGNVLSLLQRRGLDSAGLASLEAVRLRCWARGPDGQPLSYLEAP